MQKNNQAVALAADEICRLFCLNLVRDQRLDEMLGSVTDDKVLKGLLFQSTSRMWSTLMSTKWPKG